MPSSPSFLTDRARLAEFALRNRVASMFVFREYVAAGGLLSYGPSITGMYSHAADYVDRIARGSKPAELPVERSHERHAWGREQSARSLAALAKAIMREPF
jgi:ABC-type uncharacterized transport system substrate-binding protein